MSDFHEDFVARCKLNELLINKFKFNNNRCQKNLEFLITLKIIQIWIEGIRLLCGSRKTHETDAPAENK